MQEKAKLFLDELFKEIEKSQIDLKNWPIDHICYRTSSLENYEQSKQYFSQFGELLIESPVNGRLIATYKLKNPISYKEYQIPLVEVPAPKTGKVTAEGFEHIEVVIDCPFSEIMEKYTHCHFDKKGLNKELNAELEIIFENCAIKFHHQSLEDVILIEKGLKTIADLKM